MRLVAPVTRGHSLLLALRASLTRLCREPSVSIRKSILWNPRYRTTAFCSTSWLTALHAGEKKQEFFFPFPVNTQEWYTYFFWCHWSSVTPISNGWVTTVLSIGSLKECFHMTSRRPYWCLKQWNGGHVSVPNQSCGSWILFLCKHFLLCQYICIDAGYVSENALVAHY